MCMGSGPICLGARLGELEGDGRKGSGGRCRAQNGAIGCWGPSDDGLLSGSFSRSVFLGGSVFFGWAERETKGKVRRFDALETDPNGSPTLFWLVFKGPPSPLF